MLFEVSNDVRTTFEWRIERRRKASKPRPQSLNICFHRNSLHFPLMFLSFSFLFPSIIFALSFHYPSIILSVSFHFLFICFLPLLPHRFSLQETLWTWTSYDHENMVDIGRHNQIGGHTNSKAMQKPREESTNWKKKTNLLDTSWTQHLSTLEVVCAQLGRSFHWNRSTLTMQGTVFYPSITPPFLLLTHCSFHMIKKV